MRTRTFMLSLLVHATALCAAAAVRIFAATGLPEPPHPTSFMVAAAEALPDVAPPPAPRAAAAAPAVNSTAIPIEAPDSIAAEPNDIPDVAPADGAIPGGLGMSSADSGIAPTAPPAPRVAPPPPPPPPQRVGGVVRPPQKIHHVPPTYPVIAQAAKITGTVILEALIAEDGSVRDVKVLKSVTLLDASAIDAVRQWRFTPTLLNGVPVQVIMSVTVTFALN